MIMSSNSSSSSGGGGGGGGGGSGGGGGPCGACKFLRRKCVAGCIFAPYFDSEQGPGHFAAVHKVFGASNVSKLLLQIPFHKRSDAVVTICYEAQARLRDPVYGCVSHIFSLQQQVANLQAELSYWQSHLTTLELPSPPPFPPPPLLDSPTPRSMADLPSASSVPASNELSTLFDPMVEHSATSWDMRQHRMMDPLRQLGGVNTGGSGELHTLTREFLHSQTSSSSLPPPGSMPCGD